jgi:hypothetical protein
MGWTVNFANAKSVVFFIVMMAFHFVTLFIVLKKSIDFLGFFFREGSQWKSFLGFLRPTKIETV